MEDEALMMIEEYLSDMIEYVIRKYRYNVDLDSEYDSLLRYIYRRLVKGWFKNRPVNLDELENMLRNALRRKKHMEIVLSYLISRYAARQGSVYIRHSSDGRDEFF